MQRCRTWRPGVLLGTKEALDNNGDNERNSLQFAVLSVWSLLQMGYAMTVPKIDGEYAARQILAVFARYKVTVAGVLRRHQFFEVRDSDFQRGIDGAVAKGWIQRHERDRYRYILTTAGREAFNSVLIPMTAAARDGEAIA